MTLTILFAFINVIVHKNNNLIPPGEDTSSWHPEDVEDRVLGSKMTIALEQMHILTIWNLKACFLILYSRMTDKNALHKLIHPVALYVAGGFIVMEVLWFTVWCRPFNQYWAVPPNSRKSFRSTLSIWRLTHAKHNARQ